MVPDAAAWISDPQASVPAGVPDRRGRLHWQRFTYLPSIDWATDAHKNNQLGFDIDHPDAKGIALIQKYPFEPGDDYFLPYETSLPANFPKNYFYLVSSEKAEQIFPTKLHGKLQYGKSNGLPAKWYSTEAGPAIGDNGVVFDSALHESAAGFIWVSSVPMKIEMSAWSGSRPDKWANAKTVSKIVVQPFNDEVLFAALPGDDYCQEIYALRRLHQGQLEIKDLASEGLNCSGE